MTTLKMLLSGTKNIISLCKQMHISAFEYSDVQLL